MLLSKKRITAGVIFAALTLFVAVVIFLLSAQAYDESADLSNSITARILSFFSAYSSADADTQYELLVYWAPIFRNLGHFSEFFLLAFFAALSAKAFDLGWPSTFSFIGCVIYAISDELHQYFVPGRVCDFADIVTDSLGALAAVVLIYLIVTIKRNCENKRRMEKARFKLK